MNIDMNQILANLKNAFQQILAYRVVVTSPTEKVADLPLVVLILVALMARIASVVIVILAALTGHRIRIEKDLIVRS